MLPLPIPLGMIGLNELWPIFLILFLLFGATKLPALARSMGSSINQFKKGLKDEGEPKLENGSSSAGSGEKAPE